MFKQDPPKNMRTLMDKNDHPELDDTELHLASTYWQLHSTLSHHDRATPMTSDSGEI